MQSTHASRSLVSDVHMPGSVTSSCTYALNSLKMQLVASDIHSVQGPDVNKQPVMFQLILSKTSRNTTQPSLDSTGWHNSV